MPTDKKRENAYSRLMSGLSNFTGLKARQRRKADTASIHPPARAGIYKLASDGIGGIIILRGLFLRPRYFFILENLYF
jgi:hypothetical protein